MRHVAQIIRHEGCQDTFFCSSTSFHPPLFKLVFCSLCSTLLVQKIVRHPGITRNPKCYCTSVSCPQYFETCCASLLYSTLIKRTLWDISHCFRHKQRKMRQIVHVVGPDNHSTIARHDQSERAWKRHKNANSDSKTFRKTSRDTCCARCNVDNVLRTV